MESTETQKEIGQLFRISVFLKGAMSLLEIVGGTLFLVIPPQTITALGVFLTEDALSDNPNSFIASHVLHAALTYSHTLALFAGFYLISRGIIKLGLVYALLKNYIWAYPAALAVLGLFVVYQTWDILTRHSLIIGLITVFDLIVMYFIWREYKIVREREGRAG